MLTTGYMQIHPEIADLGRLTNLRNRFGLLRDWVGALWIVGGNLCQKSGFTSAVVTAPSVARYAES